MKFVKPSYEVLTQNPGIEGVYEAIERAGRVCYKSKAKYKYRDLETGEVFPDIPEADDYVVYTPGFEYNIFTGEVKGNPKTHYLRRESITAKNFVDKMINSGHLSVLEHGTVYLKSDNCLLYQRYEFCPYSKIRSVYPDNPNIPNMYCNPTYYITTNYRTLYENGWLEDLQYICEPTEYHPKRLSVKFISSIHFYKDITRHRKASFCIESSRYCNYSKNKFGKELSFIAPVWIDDKYLSMYEKDPALIGEFLSNWNNGEESAHAFCVFANSLETAEAGYMSLLAIGWSPQQAAEVLPQATKAEIICTAFLDDWEHIWDLRCSFKAITGKPHPEVSRLMDPLYREIHES